MTNSIKKAIIDGMVHNNFAKQWEERIEAVLSSFMQDPKSASELTK